MTTAPPATPAEIAQQVEAVVTIVALVLGPLLAVGLTLWAQRRAGIRNQRLWVFQTLMSTRLDRFNPERIKALGLIDIFFHRVPSVRAKWKEYYDSLNDPSYNDGKNDGANVWKRRENVMLTEMAQFLGYGREIKYEEIERAYSPILFYNNAVRDQKIAAEWLRVLEQSEDMGSPRKGPPK